MSGAGVVDAAGGDVYRVFLSSTAEDLTKYRAAVLEALAGMDDVKPVSMESFGARGRDTVVECLELVASSDVVVVVVAHRYGWVPTVDEGGDGESSITALEVAAAAGAEPPKPVLAFLVDEQHPWTETTEQDALTEATTDAESVEIGRKVRLLQQFKGELSGRIRPTFTTEDDLVAKVTTAVSNELRRLGAAQSSQGRSREFLASVLVLEALAMLHVDLMRLAVVVFDPAANRTNHNRLEEFFQVADEQIKTLDLQLSSTARELPAAFLREAQVLRMNCNRTKQALRHPQRNVGSRSVLTNLRSVADEIVRLLENTAPGIYEDGVAEARAALDKVPPADGAEIECLARRRLRAQSNLIESSPLRSIAKDFDQTLALRYFLIDHLLLHETPPSH